MDMKTRIETLTSIKEQFIKKQALLRQAKKLREGSPTNLATLLENDLEQAKLILAARDVCDKLQKIAEHLAELGAEEIMPLADSMKGAFGPQAATEFEHAANENIQTALETVRAAKDSINDAILRVEGKLPKNDMAATPTGVADMTSGQTDPNMANDQLAPPPQDDFGGAPAASGPVNEPLGRARKESRVYQRKPIGASSIKQQNAKKKDVKEAISLTQSGERLLKRVSLNSLTDWLLFEASKIMPSKKFLEFAQNITAKSISNPIATAGWIGKKRYGTDAMRQLVESSQPQSRPDALAQGIASVIATNITLFGKGKAAQVVESYTNNLLETDGSSVLEAFAKRYGSTPAMYSIKLAKMYEDTGSLSPEDDKNVSGALSQIAAKIVANPSVAAQPTTTALADVDPTAKTALQKIAGDSSTGQITNVGQLVQAANDKLKKGGITGTTESILPKTRKSSNTKNSKEKIITKEQLLNLGEKKLYTHKHPSYVIGVGAYFAGLPRTIFAEGYKGCDPIRGCNGWDAARLSEEVKSSKQDKLSNKEDKSPLPVATKHSKKFKAHDKSKVVEVHS